MDKLIRIATFGAIAVVVAGSAGAQEDQVSLARHAQEILKANCFRCHGERGSAEGGFGHVLDRRRLLERGQVVPGNAVRSRLLKRIIDGEMPVDSDRLSDADIVALRKWIEAGAPDFSVQGPRPFLTATTVFEIIRADLEQQTRSRPFLRYFTLTHLYNAGLSDEELDAARQGLSKTVNSLSFGPRIVPPQPIDPTQTVLRIDLRDYRWTDQTWEKIIAKNPYRVVEKSPAAKFAVSVTGTDEPALRGDWFIAAATVPPLYHDVLGIPQTDRELEKLLDVDVEQNIRTDHVTRAAFNNSGVSRNNRMIERHDSQFGYYWKSYDFAGNNGLKNIFAHPLGPKGKNAFEHDGGEIIFSLPNGLQAYMLIDAAGKRIDKGPIAVVSDPKRPDRAVVNGLSCMSCHTAGMLPKADQVRDAALRNPGAFSVSELDTIRTLYKPNDQLDRLFKEDSERFTRALAKTGVTQTKTDPVLDMVARFEKELDALTASAEAGVPVREFIRGIDRAADLARAFGPLKVNGGTVQREVFLTNFSKLIREYALGHETIINSVGMTLVGVPEGEFEMGSTTADRDAQPDEFPQHRVQIANSFYVGTHEVTVGQYKQFAGDTGHVGGGGYRFVGKTGSFILSSSHNFESTGLGQSDDHPVVNVSYEDAQAFCKWLSRKEGVSYRLPTEAEWEYVCRAGTTTRFATGDRVEVLRVAANLGDSLLSEALKATVTQSWNDRFALTAPVASYRPSPFGTFDLHGNVWEWCSDWYNRDYYQSSPGRDPQGPAAGSFRVVRGACWANAPENARSAKRSAFQPNDRNLMVGFRIVRER